MIIWFNCKISDIRPNPQPRFKLREDNRFDIARYSFASFAPLEPLVSKFVFNLEMADGHSGQEAEMEEWLRNIFPSDKLMINWYRCNTLAQWMGMKTIFDAIGDPLIFPAGNEDHIFLDSNLQIMEEVVNTLIAEPNVNATFMTSHWPESIRAAHVFGATESNNLISYRVDNNDAIRIMKMEFFDSYLSMVRDPNMFMFRTEQWNSIGVPQNILYIPTKEQFRHFDGYAHVGIGADTVPPLEIPPGFFERAITIKYGFNEHDPNCININPEAKTLYAEDGLGTDYRWTLDDIPMFWKPYIKEIITAPGIHEAEMAKARDINLILSSRLKFSWPHFGINFNDSNCPPAKWINLHTISVDFSD
jgi:hypothetical protein